MYSSGGLDNEKCVCVTKRDTMMKCVRVFNSGGIR